MQKPLEHNPPQVVLLGLVDTGYGMVRSLSREGITVLAFEKSLAEPELRTSLCRVVPFKDYSELLDKLKQLSERCAIKPVLFASSDSLVNFCAENYEELSGLYKLNYPSPRVVDLLLDKTQFTDFAYRNKLSIPQTIILKCRDDLKNIDTNIFPCVLKPCWRTPKWLEAKFPKVFFFRNRREFNQSIDRIFEAENNLIVQEWIPGNDNLIYFCLTYFDHSSQCVSAFTGRKLRQWRVRVGATSCAERVNEPFIQDETLRLFQALSYRGFGSVEFKKHAESGKFYIMEPTVGRPNHQSFLATANGVNMPFAAFCSLAGLPCDPMPISKHSFLWIDDLNDILSLVINAYRGHLDIPDLARTFLHRKSFRFFNLADPQPSIHLWLGLVMKIINKPFRQRPA